MSLLRKLNRLQRITLILFTIVVTNWVMASFTGYSLVGGDLFVIFFLAFLVLFTLLFFWR
jgi:uncharacterized membrane protein